MSEAPKHFDTLAAHAGVRPDPITGALTPGIQPSTTYMREADGTYPKGYVYTRTENPTRRLLENALAELEGGAACAAFASGQAAAQAVFATLRPGDHLVMPSDVYHGIRTLLTQLFEPWGLKITYADLWDEAKTAAALKGGAAMVWAETPSNPLLRVTDLARLSAQAKAAKAPLVVDNTWATPALQQPFKFGADLIVHSTTKYLGGHGDVLGGAVVSRADDERFQKVVTVQKSGGAVPSPFDAWLVLRGIRSLGPRMRTHCENAQLIAEFLSARKGIVAVHYPGLEEHPQFAIARTQMRDTGGMVSVQVDGGQAGAMRVAARVKLFTRATSLGGTESLIEHRRSVEGPQSSTPEDLLRLSIGLEHPADLIEDLDQALS